MAFWSVRRGARPGLRRRLRNERGSELVEMAFTLPLLLAVLMAIVDFGLVFQRNEVITNAAREGVRLAARSGLSDAQIQTRVGNYLATAGLTDTPTVTVTPTTTTTAGGTWRATRVDVTYPHTYTFLGPVSGFIGGSFTSLTLNASATMRNESSSARVNP